MLDWTTPFPYTLLAVIALFCIGIYSLITGRKFLKIVFGIIVLLMSANLLLLSFGASNNLAITLSDPLAQTLSLFIIIIGAVFVIIGIGLDKRMRMENEGSTLLPFDFSVEEGAKIDEEAETIIEEGV